jgi:hypothetical protein
MQEKERDRQREEARRIQDGVRKINMERERAAR